MAVSAQPQEKVDEMVKQCELKFKVGVVYLCWGGGGGVERWRGEGEREREGGGGGRICFLVQNFLLVVNLHIVEYCVHCVCVQ